GVLDSRIWDKSGIARNGRDRERLNLVAGSRSDAGQVHGLWPVVLVDTAIRKRIEGWRLVHWIDRDDEGAADCVIGGLTILERAGNGSVTEGEKGRRKAEGGGVIRAGVIDRGIGEQRRVAGNRRYGECLGFVGCARGYASQIDALRP